ncbi:MAG: hypothetical protein ACOYOK_01090, partial [Pseudobdellovibrionaceae bacterium]
VNQQPGYNGAISVASSILVTSKVTNQATTRTIYTDHYDSATVQGQLTVNGVNMNISAMCINQACSPYYLMVDAYINGQPLIQVGVKKFLNTAGGTTGQDNYQWIQRGQFLPFTSGNNTSDSRGMVGYLNQ